MLFRSRGYPNIRYGTTPSNCSQEPPAPCQDASYPSHKKRSPKQKKFVEEHLRRNTIRPSWSPYATNFFFVKKKDGKLRPVQDYRPLNKWTKKNRNVSPLIPSVVDRLAGCTLFTKFDIRWGYNNIRIKPGDEWKAAFLTPEGLFEPTVMFFGLTNSPATFQMMMNTIFRQPVMLGWFSIFMDDGVIHTKQKPGETKEQHIARHRRYVHEIFDTLAENDLYVKPEKCAFEQEEIEYLGVIVGKGRLRMDPKKLHAVLNYPTPRNATDVRAFLGFTGYYRYFVKNYSAIVRPLLALTRKLATFHWGKEEQAAFDEICTIMCKAPVLRQPDFQKKFYLQTDASAYGVGAVLSQEGDTTTPSLTKFKKPVTHPVAFFSATFTPTERNYDIYERELLAVMKALAHWRPYLGWTKFPFTIMTDHANLQYWKSPKNLNRRTARWHADLQEYDYEILYVPGKTNTPPDALSRPPGADKGETDNKDVTVLPENRFVSASATVTPEGKIIVPPILEVKRGIMTLMHDHPTAGHPGRDETIRRTQEKYWWPRMKEWIADYVKGCATCQQNKILTHRQKTPVYRIPSQAGTLPFQNVAMDLITGLPERRNHNAILTIVDQGCSRAAVFLPCNTTITRAGIAQLYFNNVVRWFGIPKRIISDRDPRFTSHFAKALATKLGINQNLSTAFHPQTDGLSERKNQWVEQYLRLVTSAVPEDWDRWLTTASAVHNNRKNQTTGLSPNQILIGYDVPLQTPNDVETNNALVERRIGIMNQRREQAIEALNKTAEKSGTPPAQYNTGDQVWLEGKNLQLPHQMTKLVPKRYGPFKIIREISPVAYRLQLPPTWTIHDVFHASLLSPYSETPSHGPNFSRPPPDLINGEEEYEVESIRSHRYFGRNKKLQFLIRWKGYAPSDDTWEPADSVHAPDLVKEYKQRTPGFRINNGPNNSSRSITLSPLWQTSQSGSLEPHPHRPRHLVPSSFTTSIQPISTRRPLPTDPTSFLALHYAQIPRVHSRESFSPHLRSLPRAHLLLPRNQARSPLQISQPHLCPRLTPCPPPPGPSRLHTSLRLAPHRPSPSPLGTRLPTTPSHPDRLLISLTAAPTSTPTPYRGLPKHYSEQSNNGKTIIRPRYGNSTPGSTGSKTLSRPTPTLSNVALKDTPLTPSTPVSPSISAMAFNGKSSGSNNWSKELWPASLRTTVRETPLTLSKFTPNPAPQQNPSNPFPSGWKAYSWGHQQHSTLLRKLQGSSTIGGSMLTCSDSGSSTRLGRRPKVKNANGRHVQTLLHLPKTCARVVWRRPTARINWARSRTWVPFAVDRNSPAEAATPRPLCVDATM